MTTTTTTMPFDHNLFSDPTFALAMEQATANGHHHHHHSTSPANVVLMDEDDGDYEDEFLSEDDQEEVLMHIEGRSGHFTLNYKETLVHSAGDHYPNGVHGVPQQKKKIRKRNEREKGDPRRSTWPTNSGCAPAGDGFSCFDRSA